MALWRTALRPQAGRACEDDPVPRHVYECPLRWADMDSLGHVNNVIYVDYLQEARIDMLSIHPSDSGARDLAEGVVVVRHEVEFLHPLVFRPHPVRVETWVAKVGAASFTLRYEIVDRDIVCCRAATVLAPFVFADEQPRRLTKQERATLEGFRDDELPSPSPPRGERS
jgi:acyl-CoA thioester hydrolase